MRVATKVRVVFVLSIALLAGVLVFHVRTIQRTVASGHELTAISARLRVSTNVQLERISEMSRSAEKFQVTHDPGYLDRLVGLTRAFGDELLRMQALPLTREERARVIPLANRWESIASEARRLANSDIAPSGETLDAVARLEQAMEVVQLQTGQLAEASRSAMIRELARTEQAARAAERVSWVVAGGTLLLGLVISGIFVRSIARPLERLALGTREISAGRFGYRIRAEGSDEFAHVARDFNAMGQRLEQLDRMKRDFVSNVSHDLKTPLSSMQEATQALLDELAGPLSEKQRHLLRLSQESGGRLSSMIAKLLELSRLESQMGGAPEFEAIDVLRLVREAVDRATTANTALKRGPVIVMDVPERCLHLRADGDGIARVLDNILENAMKFSPREGIVRVTVAERKDWLELSVADEGPGIPDAEKEQVFERFYQTGVGRAAPGRGVGLGLSICRHVVASHGGTIRIEDNAPRGSVFRVALPGLVDAPGAPETSERLQEAFV